MIDLSKLPWEELKLPEFKNKAVVASFDRGSGDVNLSAGKSLTAWKCANCGCWASIMHATVDEIEQIAKMCRMVEEFIEKNGVKKDG